MTHVTNLKGVSVQQKVAILFFCVGTIAGFLLSLLNVGWMPILMLGFAIIAIAIAGIFVYDSNAKRKLPPTYAELAQELNADIDEDLRTVRNLLIGVKEEPLRHQLDLICQDVSTLVHKVTEKSPESRISTGKFIRGNLDFIINDILPQYIEMQDTPRYFDSPERKMVQGHKAIEIFAKFLHQRIVELELADDIRYEVATEMLKALETYVNGKPVN
jgi:hypothetical protein